MFEHNKTYSSKDLSDRLETFGEVKYRVRKLFENELFEIPRSKRDSFWISEDSEVEARLQTLRFQIESLYSELCDICVRIED